MNYFLVLAKHFNATIGRNTGIRKISYLEYFYICGKIIP